MSLLVSFYNTLQALPNGVLTKLAEAMPYSPDQYAPRGFLTPRPELPPLLHSIDDPRRGEPGLDGSSLILVSYCRVRGTVIYAELRPANATWNHETFAIVPDNKRLMNAYNNEVVPGATTAPVTMPADGRVIECEPPVGSRLPSAGMRVDVWAAFSIQLAWGYVELRPCFAWLPVAWLPEQGSNLRPPG